MGFRVFPGAPAGPLVVAAAGTSDLQEFQELAGMVEGDLTMFVRLVKLGSGCAPPGGPDPLIRLSVGGGPAVLVAMFPDASSVHDAQGNFVADAMCDARGDGVYRVRVFIARPGSAWQMRLLNQDAEPRGFTWVVADNDGEAQQPWIELPSTVTFAALAGQQVTSSVRVANLGTGRLTIADAVGFRPPPGPGFELVGVPGPVSPNGCGELQVRFTAPSTPGTSTAVYTASSDDPTAGHNRRVTLTARTRKLPAGTIVTIQQNEAGNAIDIFQVHPQTGARTRVAAGALSVHPTAVAVDADDNLMVTDFDAFGGAGGVIRVDPTTGNQTKVASGQPLVSPRSIALEADGAILVADETAFGGNGGVIRVHPVTGAQTALAPGGSVFVHPVAVAVEREAGGAIFVLARTPGGATRVFRVDPGTGAQTTLTGDPPFSTPLALAVDANGGVLIADHFQTAGGGFTVSQGSVFRVDPTTGQRTRLTTGDPFHPMGLAVEWDGHILIADDTAVGGVIRMDPATGQRTTLSAATGPSFRGPYAIVVVPAAAG